MHKTRMLLGFLSLGLAAGHLLLIRNGLSTSAAGIIFHVVGGIMLASALVILAFSLLRVEEAADGSLRYDPGDPYWQMTCRFYGKTWGERMSLCKAFWGTFFILFFTFLFVAGLSGIAAAIGYTAYAAVSEPEVFKERMTSANLVRTLAMMGSIVSFILLVETVSRAMEKKKYRLHAYACALAACAAATLATVSGLPIAGFVIGLLLLIGIVVVIAFAVFAFVIAAFRLVTSLKDTWLSRALAAAKTKACPILVAAPRTPAENG